MDRHPSVFIIGYAINPLPFALLFHMLCAFPTGRLPDRLSRFAVALGYFITTVLWYVVLLFYDPTRDAYASNPLNAFDNDAVADFLIGLQSALAIVALLLIPVILRRRWNAASRGQRQVLEPVYLTAAVLMALLLLSLIADFTGPERRDRGQHRHRRPRQPRGDPVRIPRRPHAQPARRAPARSPTWSPG